MDSTSSNPSGGIASVGNGAAAPASAGPGASAPAGDNQGSGTTQDDSSNASLPSDLSDLSDESLTHLLNSINASQQPADGSEPSYNPAVGLPLGPGGAEDAFHQGDEGNCASVAAIKAAMEAYGAGMFSNVQEDANGNFNVTMRDGFSETVSAGDLAKTIMGDGLSGVGQPADFANLAYAAEVERAGLTGYDGVTNFDGALKDLNTGAFPDQVAGLLGLGSQVQKVDPAAAGNLPEAVAWSPGMSVYTQMGMVPVSQVVAHAIYVSNGVADHYGTPMAYDGTDTNGQAVASAFTFRALPSAHPAGASTVRQH